MKEWIMKHKTAISTGFALAILIGVTVVYSQQKAQSSSAQKIAALKDLRDSGVLTEQEYEANVAALKASAPAQPGPAAGQASGRAAKASWSTTRKVEIPDPQYQMTAYTLDIPSNWKFAGMIARDGGCHASGAALKFTVLSPDGLTAMVRLPGVTWTWTTSEQLQKIMAKSCPAIDIDSASSFLVNIAVPNMRPNAKIVSVQPLEAEAQATLAKQLEQQKEQNAKTAAMFHQSPQQMTLDGARVRVQYDRDGHAFEEEIGTIVGCFTTHQNAMYAMPASDKRTCTSRGEWLTRTPKGQLDAFLAMPQVKELGKTLAINQAWDMRMAQDQKAAFDRFEAANNAAFQANLKANQATFDQRIQNQKQFDANLRASTDRAMAQDRARQDAIDASAHKMALYAGDQQEFRNPSTGQVIQASNQYSHQWISSDGSTLIQTNDHTYDPNGLVYPVQQSWSELVPKQ
jgi:hypothetical protein